ncbi:hypothetical protein SKAU_G00047800 [Synaphobranchus kaupii]|uniref:Uncharacterized protein n=1 Tax=Synaphobranchus kaupii TaxID=118154 RepID=A0A9Q1G2J5_SYNKA|nr:hypothetical protein SKAU_G00047800 [Synaphobranchus kaupii]
MHFSAPCLYRSLCFLPLRRAGKRPGTRGLIFQSLPLRIEFPGGGAAARSGGKKKTGSEVHLLRRDGVTVHLSHRRRHRPRKNFAESWERPREQAARKRVKAPAKPSVAPARAQREALGCRRAVVANGKRGMISMYLMLPGQGCLGAGDVCRLSPPCAGVSDGGAAFVERRTSDGSMETVCSFGRGGARGESHRKCPALSAPARPCPQSSAETLPPTSPAQR